MNTGCIPLLRLIATIYIFLSDLVYIYMFSNTPNRCVAVVTYFSYCFLINMGNIGTDDYLAIGCGITVVSRIT